MYVTPMATLSTILICLLCLSVCIYMYVASDISGMEGCITALFSPPQRDSPVGCTDYLVERKAVNICLFFSPV